jgi:hypothetical protein
MPQRNELSPEYAEHPEYAIAALLHMLVRYPMTECGCMADSIASHLRLVARDARYPEAIRETAQDAWNEWAAMLEMRAAIGRHGQ